MGVEANHVQVPASLPTAPVHHSAVPIASDAPLTASESRGCCSRGVCKVVYHITFSVMLIAAIAFLFIGIFVDWGYFILLGIDAVVIGIVWGTYCCVYGCCYGAYGRKEDAQVPTGVPATYPVTIQMNAHPGPQSMNDQYVQQGYPIVHQTQPHQPPPYGTTYPPNQAPGPAGYGHNVAYQP